MRKNFIKCFFTIEPCENFLPLLCAYRYYYAALAPFFPTYTVSYLTICIIITNVITDIRDPCWKMMKAGEFFLQHCRILHYWRIISTILHNVDISTCPINFISYNVEVVDSSSPKDHRRTIHRFGNNILSRPSFAFGRQEKYKTRGDVFASERQKGRQKWVSIGRKRSGTFGRAQGWKPRETIVAPLTAQICRTRTTVRPLTSDRKTAGPFGGARG